MAFPFLGFHVLANMAISGFCASEMSRISSRGAAVPKIIAHIYARFSFDYMAEYRQSK